jgi:hypothetical protein
MSAVSNVLRQLKQRRLWPVAILLVAALAAVPYALAKDPEPVPPAPAPEAQEGEDILASQPIVTPAVETAGVRRKVLGTPKNPFGFTEEETGSGEPADSDRVAKADDPTTADADPSPVSPSPTGGSTPGVAPTGPTTPGTPVKPAKTYDKYDLTVRFGDSAATPTRMTLKRLKPLPEKDLPALIYLGVSKDGKSAIFLLEQGVEVVGDGVCRPTPEDCETVRLRAGETEFLDVADETGNVSAQYQLDLLKIHKGTTASAAKASASSKAGRDLLADRASADGRLPFRFDVDSGTLERRPGVVGDVARTTSAIG